MHCRLPTLLAILICSGAAGALSPSEFRIPVSELPKGGTFLRHPNNSVYYFISKKDLARHRENFGKHPGLYCARGGDKYKLINGFLDLRQVFIHPVNQKLYALVGWRHDAPGADGKIVMRGGAYLAWSPDGQDWFDMTPPRGASRGLAREDARIVQDPEHPGGLCVTALGAFGFVVRAVDDDHSKWEEVPLRDWQRRYPSTAPATQPARGR